MSNVEKTSGKYIVGIDEAGRGPLAGPVSVGMVCVPTTFDFSLFASLRDSKKLPQHKREDWFKRIKEWDKAGLLSYKVAHVGNTIIDKVGIQRATKEGIHRVLRKTPPEHSLIFLDGLLHAPARFTHQRTITKGDEKISVISLASICAKVTRDAKMRKYSREYTQYGFDQHKGYGTDMHRKAIKRYGTCALHRETWIKP